MGRFWRRRPTGRDEALVQADHALKTAQEQHAEQARKREQEREGVIRPMERFAEENHLAGWVLDIVTGNRGERR